MANLSSVWGAIHPEDGKAVPYVDENLTLHTRYSEAILALQAKMGAQEGRPMREMLARATLIVDERSPGLQWENMAWFRCWQGYPNCNFATLLKAGDEEAFRNMLRVREGQDKVNFAQEKIDAIKVRHPFETLTEFFCAKTGASVSESFIMAAKYDPKLAESYRKNPNGPR